MGEAAAEGLDRAALGQLGLESLRSAELKSELARIGEAPGRLGATRPGIEHEPVLRQCLHPLAEGLGRGAPAHRIGEVAPPEDRDRHAAEGQDHLDMVDVAPDRLRGQDQVRPVILDQLADRADQRGSDVVFRQDAAEQRLGRPIAAMRCLGQRTCTGPPMPSARAAATSSARRSAM